MKDYINQDIKARALSQSKYADLLGVSRSLVTMWLNGDRFPSIRVLMLLQLSTRKIEILKKSANNIK